MPRATMPQIRSLTARPKTGAKSSVWLVFAMIAALLLGGPLAVLDAEDHAHTVCAEHGEFIHSGHSLSAKPSDRSFVSAAPDEESHHDHCTILAVTRKLSTGAVSALFLFNETTPIVEPFAGPNEIAHRPIAIVHYAPSQSPPARA